MITPGPWRAYKGGRVRDGRENIIAETWAFGEEITAENAEANARAIAAVPEMIATFKRLLPGYEKGTIGYRWITDILARIEGKEGE